MMMVAFLMAGWAIQVELRRRGMNEDYAADIVFAAVVGGIVGAKIWYVLLTGEWDALFRRGGFVWDGGVVGGGRVGPRGVVGRGGCAGLGVEQRRAGARAKDAGLLGQFPLAQRTSVLMMVGGMWVVAWMREPEAAPVVPPGLTGTTAADDLARRH